MFLNHFLRNPLQSKSTPACHLLNPLICFQRGSDCYRQTERCASSYRRVLTLTLVHKPTLTELRTSSRLHTALTRLRWRYTQPTALSDVTSPTHRCLRTRRNAEREKHRVRSPGRRGTTMVDGGAPHVHVDEDVTWVHLRATSPALYGQSRDSVDI